MEKFLATTRVQQRFTQPFTVAYDSLIGKTTATTGASAEDEAASAATTEGAAAKEAPEADGAGSKTSREAAVANFRAQCEAHCKQELEARVVALVREGNGVEIAASVSKTRLYANLTEHVPMMCFYDAKNAKLCAAEDGRGAAREHSTR